MALGGANKISWWPFPAQVPATGPLESHGNNPSSERMATDHATSEGQKERWTTRNDNHHKTWTDRCPYLHTQYMLPHTTLLSIEVTRRTADDHTHHRQDKLAYTDNLICMPIITKGLIAIGIVNIRCTKRSGPCLYCCKMFNLIFLMTTQKSVFC